MKFDLFGSDFGEQEFGKEGTYIALYRSKYIQIARMIFLKK